MPICPTCEAEIDHLDYRAATTEYGTVAPLDGHLDWNSRENEGFTLEGFDCPECGTELFTREREAIEFLQDGQEPDPEPDPEPNPEPGNQFISIAAVERELESLRHREPVHLVPNDPNLWSEDPLPVPPENPNSWIPEWS